MVRKNKWVFLLMTLIMLSFSTQAYADVYVKGYFRKDGTYVSPHYRSNPDGNFYNNWSTYGNINPYSGEVGTKRYPSDYYYSPFADNQFLSYWITKDFYNTTYDSSNDNSYDYNSYNYDNSNDSLSEDNNYDGSAVTGISSEDTTNTTLESSENTNIVDNYIDSYDSEAEIKAKAMLVEYFNDINTRSYIPAYDCWVTEWQNKHPYDSFEEGYIDVINTIDELHSLSTDNGVSLEGTISTKEGWKQTPHKYHFVYTLTDKYGTWKLIHGKLKKLW